MMMVEKLAFKELTAALNVADRFPPSNPIRFLGDNKRRDGACILARLDRIHTFQSMGAGPQPVIDYFIKSDCNHSDHLPV